MESAPTITVSIKWNKHVFADVPLNLSQSIPEFKTQVCALSRVPVEKQKLLIKGKVLKDDAEWAAYAGIKDGVQLMLMGTAAGKELKDPSKEIKFVEDLEAERRAEELAKVKLR